MNGIIINNLWYADDTVLLAENIEYLQKMINNIFEASRGSGLSLNNMKANL